MQATKVLPEGHGTLSEIDLSKNKRAALLLNLSALPLFFGFGWLFLVLAHLLRAGPTPKAVWLELGGLSEPPIALAGVVLVLIITLILHELAHGLLFRLFTGERPTYGVRGLYAYAAAPEWYLPRGQFVVVSLAPLVLLTLAGSVLLALSSYPVVLLVVVGLTFNGAGSVGDMFAAAWVLGRPAGVLVRDEGVAFIIYGPDASE